MGLVAALALLAGCGGDGGEKAKVEAEEFEHLGGLNLVTQYAEWGIVVCRDVAGWLDDVNAEAAPLPRQAGADRPADQAAFVTFFTHLTGRTDRLLARVRGYGAPHLPGGEATAAPFRAEITRARAVFAAGRDEATAAPVADPTAFQQAVDRLQARIDEGAGIVRGAYAHMEKQGPLRLRQLFGQRDECIPIFQDSPAGPVAVPPHAR